MADEEKKRQPLMLPNASLLGDIKAESKRQAQPERPVGHPLEYRASSEYIRSFQRIVKGVPVGPLDGPKGEAGFRHGIVTDANIRPEHRARLVPVLAATRKAESARPGYAFGIKNVKDVPYTGPGSEIPGVGTAYRMQAAWSAATIQANWDRYVKGKDREGGRAIFVNRTLPLNMKDFIKLHGESYAPTWGQNLTPTELRDNKNWPVTAAEEHKKITTKQSEYNKELKKWVRDSASPATWIGF